MKQAGTWMLVALIATLILPCGVYGQGGGGTPPPGCCYQDPPPPPPPPGDGATTEATTTLDLPQITVSDETLAAMGLTRIQFLAQLSSLFFPNASQTVKVGIPLLTEVVAADGSVTTQLTYSEFALAGIDSELVDSLSVLLLTDGVNYVVVSFL